MKNDTNASTLTPGRFAGFRVLLVCLCLWCGASGSAMATTEYFNIGFSTSKFTSINENDAQAALKVWSDVIFNEANAPIVTKSQTFSTVEAIKDSLKQKSTDLVAVTTIEYEQLMRHIDFGPLFMIYYSGALDEEYLLLVHRDGPIKTLDDLRGRNLNLYNNPQATLVPLWLDVLLVNTGHEPLAGFFGRQTMQTKLANVILPVFFRQADACLVTRSGLQIMGELNPQVTQQLVVLAESKAMVPTVLAARADYNSPYRNDIFTGLVNLDKSPAGSQVLTIFNGQRIVEKPASALESALKLIETHRKLLS